VTGETIPQLAGARVANVEPGMPMHGQIEAVVVTAVDSESAAFRNGLRSGDLIVGVNRARVRNVTELIAAMRAAERPVRITLVRGEYRITLVIR
jgi:S1-C subfamily serine protease